MKVTISVPDWFDKQYPNWKKNVWGMIRAFVCSFLTTMGLMLTSVTVENFESKATLVKLIISIVVASVVSGLIGLGKFLRDLFPDSGIVQKIPF